MGLFNRSLQIALPAVAALAMAAPASAAVTFVGGYIQTQGYAYAYGGSGFSSSNGSGYAYDYASLSGPSDDVGVAGYAYAAGVHKATKFAPTVTDAWASIDLFGEFALADAANGTIAFVTNTSAEVLPASTSGAYSQAYDYYSYASYNFTIDEISDFTLNWSKSNTNTGAYNYVQLYDYSYGALFSGYLTANEISSFTETLTNIGQYQLYIENYYSNGAYVQQNAVGLSSGSRDDLYSFSILSVAPEPATWAMMIMGCGMMGAALRRRRAASVAA